MDGAIDLIVLLLKVGVVAVHRSVWIPCLMEVSISIKTSLTVFGTAVGMVVPMRGFITIDPVGIPVVGETAIHVHTAVATHPMSANAISGRVEDGGRTGLMCGTRM